MSQWPEQPTPRGNPPAWQVLALVLGGLVVFASVGYVVLAFLIAAASQTNSMGSNK